MICRGGKKPTSKKELWVGNNSGAKPKRVDHLHRQEWLCTVCDVRMKLYKRSVPRLGKTVDPGTRSACYFVIKSTLDSQVPVSEKYYWTNISTTSASGGLL